MSSLIDRAGAARRVAARLRSHGAANFSPSRPSLHAALLLAMGGLAHPLAFAQPAASPQARYGLEHRSVFEHYTPHTPTSVQSWRDSNQRVHEIGGWRAYLRSLEPDAGSPAAHPSGSPDTSTEGGRAPAPGSSDGTKGPQPSTQPSTTKHQGPEPSGHGRHGTGGKP